MIFYIMSFNKVHNFFLLIAFQINSYFIILIFNINATALNTAVEQEDIDIIKILLSKPETDVNIPKYITM